MDKLLEYLNAERGRRQKLAEALQIFPSAISQWTRVPSERLEEVSGFTGIPAEKLRPDLASMFKRPRHKAAEVAQ